MGISRYKKIIANGWFLEADYYEALDEYTKEFLDYELSSDRTREVYKRRLEAIGFTNRGHVLDAACGVGQWSAILGVLNTQVTGVDLLEKRLEIAKELNDDKGIVFQKENLNQLSFEDNTFDAYFCYGAIMFTDLQRSLAEAARVLKSGGSLYLNYNAIGWYLYLILVRGLAKGNIKLAGVALKMIKDGFSRYEQVNINPKTMERLLKKEGFEIIAHQKEGTIALDKQPVKQFYGSFLGLAKTYEVLAVKK